MARTEDEDEQHVEERGDEVIRARSRSVEFHPEQFHGIPERIATIERRLQDDHWWKLREQWVNEAQVEFISTAQRHGLLSRRMIRARGHLDCAVVRHLAWFACSGELGIDSVGECVFGAAGEEHDVSCL
ncbi:hypothetical protein BKA25_003064 [Actinoalloteichus hymeniacidonis]|nr:hypothetical protein [Actinoalloteichus hymeniacidonis]MBB5908748.1 hypothetical protein [Actinoalloteichus hymeniacidonis]